MFRQFFFVFFLTDLLWSCVLLMCGVNKCRREAFIPFFLFLFYRFPVIYKKVAFERKLWCSRSWGERSRLSWMYLHALQPKLNLHSVASQQWRLPADWEGCSVYSAPFKIKPTRYNSPQHIMHEFVVALKGGGVCLLAVPGRLLGPKCFLHIFHLHTAGAEDGVKPGDSLDYPHFQHAAFTQLSIYWLERVCTYICSVFPPTFTLLCDTAVEGLTVQVDAVCILSCWSAALHWNLIKALIWNRRLRFSQNEQSPD